MFGQQQSWVLATISSLLICGSCAVASAQETTDDAAIKSRFQSLSQHGNVECSVQFEKLIGSMGPEERLQGSCCARWTRRATVSRLKASRSTLTSQRSHPIHMISRDSWRTG